MVTSRIHLRKQRQGEHTIEPHNTQTPRFLNPTIQFVQQYLTDNNTDDGAKLLVPELVLAGQVLADYPEFERLEKKGFQRGPLIAGPNTIFSEDGAAVLSAIIGYPKIKISTRDDGTEISAISVTPLVKFSFDKLSASLLIYPPLPEHNGLSEANLDQLLKEAGLIYGIDQQTVIKAKQLLTEGKIEMSELLIAKGTPPGPGTDAHLSFALEIGPIAGLILEDGRIDFRERKVMVAVLQNQLIAAKIPAVPGSSGTNVLGEIIEPKTGKDITVKNYGDSTYSAETLQVRATRDGALSVTNNTIIKVSARQLINSDIDFKTGNAESNGCLSIKGSVQPGFKVTCGGDLEIGGSVMSAQISCGANCVIKGGITGKNSTVSVEGDTDIKFIEQGKLSAGGIVVIRKQAYFSPITSKADIRCHPESTIMGGSLIAAGHLTTGNVGTESSDPAVLAAGVDPERLQQYKDLQQKLKDAQNEIIEWLQMHGNARSRKVRKMEAAVDETKLHILQFNLIPGTELFSRNGTGSSRDEIEEINPIYHQGTDVDKIRLDIHGTAFEGTTILLGNRSLIINKPVTRRQFKLSADMKRIIALPLRG